MKYLQISIVITSAIVLSACSAKQEVTRLAGQPPATICVVKHDAVKEGVLTAITEQLSSRQIDHRVVDGSYEKKHNLWHPRWYPEHVKGCDALFFYAAKWSWDLAVYMSLASIWMTDVEGTNSIARATYDATSVPGPSKFISAEKKIKELVDEMFFGPTEKKKVRRLSGP